MNKIFKVIWNHAIQSFVVVSELTKSKGKQASIADERDSLTKSLIALGVSGTIAIGNGVIGGSIIGSGVLAAGLLAEPVYAAMTVCGTGAAGINSATSTNATAIGYNAKVGSDATAVGGMANASGGESVAVGNRSKAAGYLATALGSNSNASANSGTAIGTSAKASGGQATAIGGDANASGYASVAIGADDIDGAKTTNITLGSQNVTLTQAYSCLTNGSTLISTHPNGTTSLYRAATASGVAAVAIGSYAQARGHLSTAIGTNATASNLAATALGVGALANGTSSFAMGTGTKAVADNSVAIGTSSNATAENGTAIGTYAKAGGQDSVALGKNTVTMNISSVAIGSNAKSLGNRSIAMGDTTNATINDDIAIGSYAKTNTKQNLKASNGGTIAIGVNAKSDGDNALAIGNNATAENASAIAFGGIASGVGATNIGYQGNTTGSSSVGIGYYAKSVGNYSIAIGGQAKAGQDLATAIGSNANATQQYSVAIGSNANSTKQYSVALGASSTTDSNATSENSATVNNITYSGFSGEVNDDGYQVSVGSSTIKRQIKNVAAGNISAASTDAINGSQLYVTNQVIGNLANSIKDNFGGNAKVNANGTITYTNIGGTGKNTIHDAIVAVKEAVVAGTNANVTSSIAANGSTTYTVNAWNTTLTNGSKELNVTSQANNTNRVLAYTVDLSTSAKNNITTANATAHNANATANTANTTANAANATANTANTTANTANATANTANTTANNALTEVKKGWNITTKANGGNAANSSTEQVNMGELVTFEAGKNINLTQKGANITIATSDKPTFNTVTTQNFNVQNGGTVDMGGNVVSNVGTAVNGTDAVNYDLLNKTVKAASSSVIAGTNTNVQSKVDANGTVYTINAYNTTVSNASDAVTVTPTFNAQTNTTNYTVDLSAKTKQNITTANTTAHNANATANAANTTVNKGWNITTAKSGTGNVANNTDANVQMGDKVIITAGDNVNISQNGKNITIATSNKPTFSNVTTKDLNVQAGGTVNMGGNAITNVANGTKPTDAVNLQQLNASKVAVLAGLNTGVSSKANATTGGTDYVVNGWNTTAQAAANGNVTVTSKVDSANNTIDYTIDLTQTTKDTITNANVTAHNANATANLANTTANTANATVNKGWNLTANKDTTAENIQMGDTVDFSQGDNIIVTRDGKGIKIATSLKPTFTDMTTTNLSVKNGGNIDMGGNKVQNVANGTSANDAVNLQQLNASRTFVEAGTHANVTSAVGTDGSTTYTVNAWNTTAKGSSDIKVTNVTDAAGRTIDYTIDLSDSAKNNITTANNTANAANATVNKGWNITTAKTGTGNAENISDTNVQMGGKVIITAGDNVNVSQNGSNITIATSKTPTFTSVTAGNTQITNEGLTIQNGPSITNNGINAGNKVITNVANGTNGTDAVNLDQLNEVKAATTTTVTSKDNSISVTESLTNGRVYDLSIAKSDIVTNPNGTTANKNAGNTFVTGDNLVNVLNNTSFNVTSGSVDSGKVTGTKAEKVKAGETVTFKAGNNLVLAQDGQNFTYSLSDNITLTDKGSIKLGNTTITDNNVTVGDVSVTDKGINAANTTISNVKDGKVEAGSKEAVNGGQLFNATTNLTNAGLNFVGNNVSGVIHKNLSQTLSIVGELANTAAASAKNVRVDTENGKLVIKLSENPTFTTVTTGNSTLNDKGLTIKDGPSITNKGIDAANKPITNVAKAVNGTDAVNLDQLNTTVKAASSSVIAGTNVNVTSKTDANGTVYTVNAFNTTASAGSDAVTVNGTFDPATNNTNYVVDLSDKTKNTLADTTATVNKGWNITTSKSAGEAKDISVSNVKMGDTVTIDAGKNINITQNGAKISIATSDKPTFTTATVGNTSLNGDDIKLGNSTIDGNGLTINNGPSVTNNGIDAANTTISNVKDGKVEKDSKEAVNGGQLFNATTNLTNAGLNFVGNNVSGVIHKNLSDTLAIVGELENTSAVSAKNIRVDTENGRLVIKLSENPTFTAVTTGNTTLDDKGLTINNGPSVTKNGIDVANKPITNVANGVNGTDAVNLNQLNETKAAITTTVKSDDKSITVKENLTNGRVYDISVAQAEVVTNPNGTTANNKAGNTFVTGDNLVNVLNNISFNVTSGNVGSGTVTGTTSEQVKVGETVTFKAGNNLALAQDGQNFTYSLSDNITLTDKGSIKLGNTTITDNNVTVGGVSVTDKGINAANNTISNVKDGEVSATSKDAVNGSQLHATNQNVTNVTNTVNKGWNITTSASTGSVDGTSLTNVKMGDTVTIDAGKNINITQTAGKISIATSDKPTFSNVTVGDTKIDNDGVTINNGPSVTKNGIDAANTTISNVKDGKVEAGSKEAVNGGQLFNATTNLTNAGLNFVGNNVSGVIHKNLSQTLSIVGELANTAAASAKNVRVDTENGKLVIKLSENPTF
uniref:ESPR-type extended signal peptide-containing protein n=1 Tax=Actinobacillus capsulatus TaxID=717 RepID=UPI0003718623